MKHMEEVLLCESTALKSSGRGHLVRTTMRESFHCPSLPEMDQCLVHKALPNISIRFPTKGFFYSNFENTRHSNIYQCGADHDLFLYTILTSTLWQLTYNPTRLHLGLRH